MLWRWVVAVVAVLVVAGSCSVASGPSDLDRSEAAPTGADSGSTTDVPDEPGESVTTGGLPASSIGRGLDLQWDSTYRTLHGEAITYLEDPLGAQAAGLSCPLIAGCDEYDLLAAEGKAWSGMNDGNLIVTAVQTLEELGPDVVHLKVTINATEPIELVDDQGEIFESIDIPFDAASRVVMQRIDGQWRLENVAAGRFWATQANPVAGRSFEMIDPLNKTLVPTGQDGRTVEGIEWETSLADERFCVRARYRATGLIVRCISRPIPAASPENGSSGDGGSGDGDGADHGHEPFGFQMAFSSAGLQDTYLVLWFGVGVETGVMSFADGTERRDELFDVDTSEVFDDVQLRVGISAIDHRPQAVTALGPEGPLMDEPFRLD